MQLLFTSLIETTLRLSPILILWSKQKAWCAKSKILSAFKLNRKNADQGKKCKIFCCNYLINGNLVACRLFLSEKSCDILSLSRRTEAVWSLSVWGLSDWPHWGLNPRHYNNWLGSHHHITLDKKSLLFLSPMFLFLWDWGLWRYRKWDTHIRVRHR